MSSSLTLPDIHTVWLVMGLSALLLSTGVSIYLASKRLSGQPKRLALVIAFNILACIALVGLIADIKLVKTQLSQARLLSENSLPLSTENQQLLDTMPEAKLFVLDTMAAEATKLLSNAQVISEPTQLLDWLPQLQQLTLVGDGLSASEWQTIKARQNQLHIDFRPSEPLTGLVNVSWNQHLVQGQYLTVSGQLQIAAQDKNAADLYVLSLADPMGNQIAQLSLRAGENFNFSVQPPTTGNWLYQLNLEHKDTLTNQVEQTALITEQVAVAVTAAKPVSLLIYQSAPSFETRQLREWAGSFTNKVTVVTQISKNKHLTQHFNFSEQTSNIESLEQANLSQFDLIIMDGRALSLISQQEWLALKQAVQQGLGLLLMADQSLSAALAEKDKGLASQMTLSPISQQGVAQAVVPNWPHSQITQAIQAQPLQLLIKQGEDLVVGPQQQALVSALPIGLGKLAITLLNNTYQWQTSGMPTQYSSYWQYLFSSLAANRESAYWQAPSSDSILRQNQMGTACVVSQYTNPQAQLVSSAKIPAFKLNLTSDLLQRDHYCAVYWPQTLGWWQQLRLLANNSTNESQANSSDSQMQYVYGRSAWKAQQQQHKQHSTAYQAKLSQTLAPPLPKPQSSTLNKLWSWLLWLSACSFLWIERKQFLQGSR